MFVMEGIVKLISEDVSTEEKIIQATLDVIEQRSISDTRMRYIAEKANVFQSNLHYYYKSKKELLLAAQKKVADRCIELRAQEKRSASDNFESQLEVFIRQKLIFIKEEPKYDYAEIDFWVQSRFDEDFRAEFKRSFFGWRQDLKTLMDTYAPQLTESKKNLLASVIISLLEGASIQYLADADAFSVDEYFDYCKGLIMREIQ